MRRPRVTHVSFDPDDTLCSYPLSAEEVVGEALGRCSVCEQAFGPARRLAERYDALWHEGERAATSAGEFRNRIWCSLLTEVGREDSSLARPIAAAFGDVRRKSGVCLFRGVEETLVELRARGYGLGMLTNGLSDMQWEKIHSLSLDPLIDTIVVAGDISAFRPDARACRALLDRLPATAAETLSVGYSCDADVDGAHAVGLSTAWICSEGTACPGTVVPEHVLVSVTDVLEVAA